MRPQATSVCGLKLLVHEAFSHYCMSAISLSLSIQETGVSQKAPDDMLYDDILHNITGANKLRQHTSAYVSIRQHPSAYDDILHNITGANEC
jgi:hypothetical protein